MNKEDYDNFILDDRENNQVAMSFSQTLNGLGLFAKRDHWTGFCGQLNGFWLYAQNPHRDAMFEYMLEKSR